MKTFQKLTLGMLSLYLLVGCGKDPSSVSEAATGCTLAAVAGVSLTVKDTAGAPIDDAQVVIESGSYQEELKKLPIGSGHYAGAWERAGTYTATISKPGYTSVQITGLVVTEDECHVNGVSREVMLQ